MVELYGEPKVNTTAGGELELWWMPSSSVTRSMLIKQTEEIAELAPSSAPLRFIYGDAVGGSLIGGTVKVALIGGRSRLSLYSLPELRQHEAVQRALSLDPAITFFMDSANVWFYGVKNHELFVYDVETDELDPLGPIETGLVQLLREWEEA